MINLRTQINKHSGHLVLLSDFKDPVVLPGWLRGALDWQANEKLRFSPGFDSQNRVIKYFYDKMGCDTFIDLGCWLGVLSVKLHQLIKPKKMILIDAVPIYILMAKELFKKYEITDNVYAKTLCVVPKPNEYPGYFLINLNESIHTSNVMAMSDWMKNIVALQMPTSVGLGVDEAARILGNTLTENSYLKIDIDSLDGPLVLKMLELGYFPKAMCWENLTVDSDKKVYCKQLAEKIKNYGYKLPENIDDLIDSHSMIDIYVGGNDWAISCYDHPKSSSGEIMASGAEWKVTYKSWSEPDRRDFSVNQ